MIRDQLLSQAHVDGDRYRKLYESALEDPDSFWLEQAKNLDWITFPTQGKNTTFAYPDVSIRWFEDGVLNACHNCLDRHLDSRGDQTAIIWERDRPGESVRYTYRELHREVCRMANTLKKMGVAKGDRVVLYLPMIPEAACAMLACARIGAVHSVVFGGFSPDALADRVQNSDAKLVITADQGERGGRRIPLWNNTDTALRRIGGNVRALVVRCTDFDTPLAPGRDCWYDFESSDVDVNCPAEPMSAEDPLFILYTSGSTGTPKGVLHTTGGYLLYASLTHKYVFDYRDGDVYWCTADVGWVTGHSYIVYGPLANGATSLMFEGVPTYPSPSRFWEVCEEHSVNVFYTAPTAIRALMGKGDGHVEKCDLSSLRVLGSVGEPINPEAWHWYSRVVGGDRCPVIDTWWQTETGGILISPLPGATPLKPGSATLPFFGVQPAILDTDGNEVDSTEAEGALCIKDSWPGQMRTVYGDHERFVKTYFETFKGYYFTGDGCTRDSDGYYWITGRMDDVLNVSGHRMGTAEIESSLVAHPAVSEAAVVGYPHDIKGQGIYCYVTLMESQQPSDELRKELIQWVRKDIGAFAGPDLVQFAPGLPKTRSGKIMRRILRKIAEDDFGNLGDTSTLAEPEVVDSLIENRQNRK